MGIYNDHSATSEKQTEIQPERDIFSSVLVFQSDEYQPLLDLLDLLFRLFIPN